MLNNITNFFNLIKTGKVKTQLDGTDLLPIGTRDTRFSGQYQPTMIKYSDLVAGMIGGSDGQVLFKDNGVANGAANLYWDKVNNRLTGGPVQASAPWILQTSQNNYSDNTNLMFYSPGAWGGLLTMPPFGYYNTMLNGRIIGTDGGVGNAAIALGTVVANSSGANFNIAIGGSASVTGAKSLAVGYQAVVTTDNATAIGFGATTSTLNGFALGNANSLLQIGGDFTPLAKVHIKGQGNTSATTSLLVQQSTGVNVLSVRDDMYVTVQNTNNTECFQVRGFNDDATIRFTPSGGTSNITLRSQSSYITLSTTANAFGDLRVSGGAQTLRIGTSSTSGGGLNYYSSINGLAHSHRWFQNNIQLMRLATTGNLLINTDIDSGFKLDVEGAARVSATDGVSGFQITTPTRAWYFTTSSPGGTFNAISAGANGASGPGNYGFVLGGGWAFNIGLTSSQPNSFFSVYPSATNNGEVRIGGQTGNASSLLTLESTTKGFLPPRMTTTEKNAIASPAAGLMVYDNTLNRPCFYNGTSWITL